MSPRRRPAARSPGVLRRATPRPWLAVVLLVMMALNLRAALTGIGPLLPQIAHERALSTTAGSLLIAVPLLCFACVSWTAPRLLASWGQTRVLGISLLVLSAGAIARSVDLAGSLWWGSVLIGIAIGVLNVAVPAYISASFPRRIALLTGIYTATQAGAGALAAATVVPTSYLGLGWSGALALWALPALLAGSAVLTAMPLIRAVPSPEEGSTVSQRPRSVWRTRLGWRLSMTMGLQSAIFYSAVAWWPSMQAASGVPADAAALNQGVMQLSGIAGSFVAAALLSACRRDQRPAVVVLVPIPAIALLGYALAPVLPTVWSMLLGFGATANLVLAVSLIGIRSGSPAQTAAHAGMANSVGYAIAAAGPVAVGMLHDVTGSWMPATLLLTGISCMQIVIGLRSAQDLSRS